MRQAVQTGEGAWKLSNITHGKRRIPQETKLPAGKWFAAFPAALDQHQIAVASAVEITTPDGEADLPVIAGSYHGAAAT